jgi:hypothetical protein
LLSLLEAIFKLQKALIKNYYKEFIVSVEEDNVDLEKYPDLVMYRGNEYFEQDSDYITKQRKYIIDDIKPIYLESISEVILKLSSLADNNEKLNYLKYTVQLFNIPLRQLKVDFHVHQEDSRYYSESQNVNQLSTVEEIAESILKEGTEEKVEKFDIPFYQLVDLFLENYKQKTLSFLPLSLSAIGNSFIKILFNKIDEIEEEIENAKPAQSQIEWLGKTSHLGYIMGQLAELEYISPKRLANGEINFTQFSKDVLNKFKINATIGSLAAYLNITNNKAQETHRTFEKANFNIPHKKEVS